MRKSKTAKILEEIVGPLTFGRVVWARRLGDELTLEALASKLGVSRGHLCDIEKGRRSVSPERAARWAKLLGESESVFVELALQAELDAAGLKYRVTVEAA